MHKPIEVAAGDCLIAPPNCPDPRFKNSVVYLWEHGEAGSQGVVLNRPSNHTIGEVVDDFDQGDRTVNWGGPVYPNVVFIMHTADWGTSRTKCINGVCTTSDNRMFEMMKRGSMPNRWEVFFGHSSWAPGQLEGELSGTGPWTKGQSWLILKNVDPEWVFETDPENMWDQAILDCSKQTIDSWI